MALQSLKLPQKLGSIELNPRQLSIVLNNKHYHRFLEHPKPIIKFCMLLQLPAWPWSTIFHTSRTVSIPNVMMYKYTIRLFLLETRPHLARTHVRPEWCLYRHVKLFLDRSHELPAELLPGNYAPGPDQPGPDT